MCGEYEVKSLEAQARNSAALYPHQRREPSHRSVSVSWVDVMK